MVRSFTVTLWAPEDASGMVICWMTLYPEAFPLRTSLPSYLISKGPLTVVMLAVTFVTVPTGPDDGSTRNISVDARVLGRSETVMKAVVIMRVRRVIAGFF